jgi:hypothetical protein
MIGIAWLYGLRVGWCIVERRLSLDRQQQYTPLNSRLSFVSF